MKKEYTAIVKQEEDWYNPFFKQTVCDSKTLRDQRYSGKENM